MIGLLHGETVCPKKATHVSRKKESKHLSKISKAYIPIYFPKKAYTLCFFGKVEIGLSIRPRPFHLARPLS